MKRASVTVRFEEITHRARKCGMCVDCARRVRRQCTFGQTVNPWNLRGGRPKTVQEIQEELVERAAVWMAEPVRCAGCEAAGGSQ